MKPLLRLILLGSMVTALVVGMTGVASATTGSSDTATGTLPPGAEVCAGPIDLGAPLNIVTITGTANGPVRWSIWSDNDGVLDPPDSFRLFKTSDSAVNHTELSNGSHFWGCAFNPFSSTVTVNAAVTISG